VPEPNKKKPGQKYSTRLKEYMLPSSPGEKELRMKKTRRKQRDGGVVGRLS
jgi:hypothetical protein